MLHRGTCALYRTMTIHIGYQDFCGSYVFLCCIGLKLFLSLHVPRVKETPSFGFSRDGLLLSEV